MLKFVKMDGSYLDGSYLLFIYLSSTLIGVYNVFKQEKGVVRFLWAISMICIPVIVSLIYIIVSTVIPSNRKTLN